MRAAVYAASGTVGLPRLDGKVVPMSGGDFPLTRSDGVIDFDARYLIEADDGAIVCLENRGYRWARDETAAERMQAKEDVDFDDHYMCVTPRFDAPAGPHEWVSRQVFVRGGERLPGSNHVHCLVVL